MLLTDSIHEKGILSTEIIQDVLLTHRINWIGIMTYKIHSCFSHNGEGGTNIEIFYLNSALNFGIPAVLVFQLEVYYKVDRLLTGLTKRNNYSMVFK